MIGLCYRSDNTLVVGQENEVRLRGLLHEVCNQHLILMGDFNYPGIDWSLNSTSASVNYGTSDFLQTVDYCFLVQHVQDPTRVYAVLDLIFTKDPDLVSDVQITSTGK